MNALLDQLRAAAEPTRLRLLALAARGAFCVTEFCEILGQSQPRLSRHLKLLAEAGLLAREREGANAWFVLPGGPSGVLARDLVARIPQDDPMIAADRRQAARVLAERARVASDSFSRAGADWDEMRALDLPAPAVEQALLDLVRGDPPVGNLLDIGTGTGRLLEVFGPRIKSGLGIDASKAMLALARARLARAELPHCTVRLADMYRLPMEDASFDLAVLQMVLHHAEDPAGVLAEAARVLRPRGTLLVVDLVPHGGGAQATKLAHRWPGFSDARMAELFAAARLRPGAAVSVSGTEDVRVWPAQRLASTRPQHVADDAVAAVLGSA